VPPQGAAEDGRVDEPDGVGQVRSQGGPVEVVDLVQVLRVDDADDVRVAVAGLPERLAELIRLVHWDGFSIEQAAQHMGINPSTARSRHARAKDLIRQQLLPVSVAPGRANTA
jgi:RNA polymerase sigma-70 factor (ECF subfamily)